jgi:hypothetical protein
MFTVLVYLCAKISSKVNHKQELLQIIYNMFTTEEINELKESLPKNGIHLIYDRTGISRPTIYKFFEVGDVRLPQMEKIWIEGWLVVKEFKEKKAELKSHAQEVINLKV